MKNRIHSLLKEGLYGFTREEIFDRKSRARIRALSGVRDGKKIFHLTVFAVEKGETAAGVLEDITAPRVRIDKTVERAREIIKKNVSVVQQIAFLLGENAAESEAILNSIIESYTEGEA